MTHNRFEVRQRRSSVALDLLIGAIVIAGIIGLFLFDISQVRRIVDSVGYAAIVAISARYGKRALITCAVVTTTLTVAAPFLQPGIDISTAAIWENRGFAVLSIWIVAGILFRRLGLEAYITSRESRLRNFQNALGTMIREALLANLPLQERIHRIMELSADAIRCDLSAVLQPAQDKGAVRIVDLWERNNRRHSSLPNIPANISPQFRAAIESDFVVVADDVLESPAHRDRLDILAPLGIRAILVADTLAQQPGAGYVAFAFRQTHAWSQEEIAFARGVANLTALLFASHQNTEILAALDLVGEAIYTEDEFGTVQYANRAAKRLCESEGCDLQQGVLRPSEPLAGDGDMHEVQVEGRDLEIARRRLPHDGILTRINDVTARNSAVAALMQYEARLQQSAKMDAVGQLAGGIAHDFNNILGSIMGFAGFLVQDLPEPSAEYGFAERIVKACGRGKDLVDQMLAFARARGIERGVVDLGLLLRRNRDFLAEFLPPQVDLQISIAEEALPVLGSAAQMGQLIKNLCSNARDAFADGEGTLAITARLATPREIDGLKTPVMAPGARQFGELRPDRTYSLLRVEDNGRGIPPDILDRVFEPFFTTKGRHRGTGLGLAVVHGVVESAAGVCRLTSLPGEGTSFSIYFPLANEAAADTGQLHQPTMLRGNERILIVDDEPDIADMLAIGLERLGYVTVGVIDPLEALAAFQEDPQAFDAVVTDQVMPGLRGLDLIRRLKELRPEIKAILCTGYSDGANAELSRSAGTDAYFHKPIDAIQIAHQIRILISQDD